MPDAIAEEVLQLNRRLLESIDLEDGAPVTVEPPAILRCEMAEAVTEFVRHDLAPAAAALGSPLSAIAIRPPGRRLRVTQLSIATRPAAPPSSWIACIGTKQSEKRRWSSKERASARAT